jgi:hypothetical protein
MSSPPTNKRPSRFIEGSPLTRPDLLKRTPTSHEQFLSILSEMDEFEKKRKHRDSSASVESLGSPTAQHAPIIGKREVRRSFGSSRPSLDERSHDEEKLSRKFKGRLRAFTTGGKDRDGAKPAT